MGCGDSGAMLVATTQGQIKLFNAEKRAFETIASYNGQTISLECVSENGELAIWTVIDTVAETNKVYCYYKGEISAVGSMDASQYAYAYCSSDGKSAYVDMGKMLAYIRKGEIETIKFPEEIYSFYPMGGSSLAAYENMYRDKGAFVACNNGEGVKSLYYVDYKKCDKYKLTADISTMYLVSEDRIIYKNTDGELCFAAFDRGERELKDEETITTSDVYSVHFSEKDSDYIYYLTDYDNSGTHPVATLYAYDIDDDSSKRIKTDICAFSIDVSSNGNSIFYFDDVARDDENHVTYGTLKQYDAKRDKSKKIDDDVCAFSLNSGLVSEEILKTSFFYEVYLGDNSYDLCYWNGHKAKILKRDVEKRLYW